jgi:hypothetical protein
MNQLMRFAPQPGDDACASFLHGAGCVAGTDCGFGWGWCLVSVNEAWRRCVEGMRAGMGLGANYLDVCGKAEGAGADNAAQAAGITAVLCISRKQFQMEYPCHPEPQTLVQHDRVTNWRMAGAAWWWCTWKLPSAMKPSPGCVSPPLPVSEGLVVGHAWHDFEGQSIHPHHWL